MLFDLKGKRRRLVQGTYLMLAILLGGGLVLFGIGSSTNGGLGDLFKGGNGSNNGNEVVHKRIDAAEKLLQVNPRNEAALAQVIRGRYQLATADSNPNTGAFGSDGRKQLLLASNTWDRYMSVAKKPDPSLAGVMVQGYTGLALGEGQGAARAHWLKASQAAQLLAAAQPSPAAYIRLVQFAT